MAVQENTKPVTDHINDTIKRIAQSKAVLRSLAENCKRDGDDGMHFGEGMLFDEVVSVFWAVDDLLEQAMDFCQDGHKAACEARFSNLVEA